MGHRHSRAAVTLLVSSALSSLLVASASGQNQNMGQQADVLITGGKIYDGSTAAPITGDVAITGDKIVYVGPKAPMTAKRTIDAHGMMVSPGLIDAHTHADHFLEDTDKGQRANPAWVMQGVSTVFVGVDGNGPPDLKAKFAQYRKPRASAPMWSPMSALAPSAKPVLGEAARAPTAAEAEKEKQLVIKGMCEGAIGLSAGLFYAPQNFATTEEVIRPGARKQACAAASMTPISAMSPPIPSA